MSLLKPGDKDNLSTNDTAATRPSAIAELIELAQSYNLPVLDKLVAEGHKGVWSSTFWEAPLIYASDSIPASMLETWRFDSREAESVGENYFQIPPEFCSMIKTMIGRLHLRAPDPIKKFFYFGGTCEPISSAMELAQKDGYDVFCIENVTAFKAEEKRPEVIEFLVKELERLTLWLNDGKPIDESKLRAELERKNLVNAKVRKILDLRLQVPLYLTSGPTMQMLLGTFHYFAQPEKYIALLDRLIDELTEAAKTPENRFYIPLLLAGLGNGPILKVIDESHGAILGWAAFESEDYRLDVPPLESIAHFLLDSQKNGDLGEGLGTSATYRRFRVEEVINKTGAKGIVSFAVTGCPYASVVQKTERDHFKGLGIPVITLETNVHGERPAEEQIMRVKTFVEMLS